jgi:hypothetical protein
MRNFKKYVMEKRVEIKIERERGRSMWLSRILLLYIYEAVTPFGVHYLLVKLLAHRE